MTHHVMIDLETFGVQSDAVILSIGAVKFNPMSVSEPDDRFYVTIDPANSVAYGLKLEPSTVMWWMHPDRTTARNDILESDLLDLPTALDGFAQWYGPDSLPTWGNGAAFDNVILRTAFKKIGLDAPWGYRHDRCYRTFASLAPGLSADSFGVAHNALDDAAKQVQHLRYIVNHLGLSL